MCFCVMQCTQFVVEVECSVVCFCVMQCPQCVVEVVCRAEPFCVMQCPQCVVEVVCSTVCFCVMQCPQCVVEDVCVIVCLCFMQCPQCVVCVAVQRCVLLCYAWSAMSCGGCLCCCGALCFVVLRIICNVLRRLSVLRIVRNVFSEGFCKNV